MVRGDHAGLANDHANLAIDLDGLDQKLDQVLADIRNIMVGAPCSQGTAGQRFVGNGQEVCDNTTGLYWEQSPSTSEAFAWSSNEGHQRHRPLYGLELGATRIPIGYQRSKS